MAATLCDNIQEYVVPPGVTAVRIATWCHRGDPLPVIRSLAPLIRCSARPARRWTERPPKVRAGVGYLPKKMAESQSAAQVYGSQRPRNRQSDHQYRIIAVHN